MDFDNNKDINKSKSPSKKENFIEKNNIKYYFEINPRK